MFGHRKTRLALWTVGLVSIAILGMNTLAGASPDAKLDEKLANAREVYTELLQGSDSTIPQALRDRCRGIAVIPHVLKGAIGYGARYGQGVITCRDSSGQWSPVVFVKLTGGSFGFQIGAQSTDIVLFFMTDRSVRSLVKSKFTLGGNVSVAAGPLGRAAEATTDVRLDAEIYSYAKSKGLFAGVSLEGARLAPDKNADARFYGKPITADELLFQHADVTVPESAAEFLKAMP